MPGVCERLEPYLASQLVGQELALRQLADAVCDHTTAGSREQAAGHTKPLVLSVHGPPGVGKSLAHLLLARALYNPDPAANLQCPGPDCPGYKVTHQPCIPWRQHRAHAMHQRSPAVASAARRMACPGPPSASHLQHACGNAC